jgi:hypothetical protein
MGQKQVEMATERRELVLRMRVPQQRHFVSEMSGMVAQWRLVS